MVGQYDVIFIGTITSYLFFQPQSLNPGNLGGLLFNNNPRPSYRPQNENNNNNNNNDAMATLAAAAAVSPEQMAMMNEILKQMSNINNAVGSSNAVSSGLNSYLSRRFINSFPWILK